MRTTSYLVLSLSLTAAAVPCFAQGKAQEISKFTIHATHMGWGSTSTNLTLVRSNGVFAAGAFSVPVAAVSNLLAAARGPRLKQVDPANLGLNAAWLATNRSRLLGAFAGETEKGVFPNASARQREWLTNALLDLDLLGEMVGNYYSGLRWTDDYPEMELRFEKEEREQIERVFGLKSESQKSFMVPWEVWLGTNHFITHDAEISRALVEILPPGFMHRDRIRGDLAAVITGQFPEVERVQEYIKRATLEETLGASTNRLLRGFEMDRYWMPGGSYGRFPETWMATLHHTNWPKRLTMPINTAVERGVVKGLASTLENAAARVAPLLKYPWLINRLQGPGQTSVEIHAQGSPDHQWLRGHMAKVGLGGFYDRIQPQLKQSQGFLLREGTKRTSEWAVLPDGKLLVFGFTGDGVLDWTPEQLGWQGDRRQLNSLSIQRIGVFVTSEGRLEEVVPRETK
jgi:hypothetical protein